MDTTVPSPLSKRSAAAQGLCQAARKGSFELQTCGSCENVQYPPQAFCLTCLSDDLRWEKKSPRGKLLAEATVYHSFEPYFDNLPPQRTGLVQLESGAILIVFLQSDCVPGDLVDVTAKLSGSGGPVFSAAKVTT